MSLEQNELISYLKELGLEEISKNEKKIIYDKLNSGSSKEQVKKELELLFMLNKVLVASYGKVSISNMMQINEDIDNELIVKLFLMYNEIKNKSNDPLNCLKEFKNVACDILNLNKKANNLVEETVKDSMNQLVQIKNAFYLTMVDKDKADKLLNNCLRRSKNFISQSDATNIEYLVSYLKKNYSLSDDELVDISKRCATFFSFSSASKIENISNTIKEFKNYIEKRAVIDKKSMDISRLLSKDFKDILTSTSSIAVNNPEVISKTVKFLTGSKLGELVSVEGDIYDIKGNFTPLQLAKIYNESITSLSINVEKVADVCKNISSSYERYFNSKLDLNNLINGHNFSSIDQLSKEDYLSDGKINDIFKLLEMFISKEDMENLLRNNFSFLIASVSDVKKSLRDAVLNSQNNDDLRKNVLQKIRNHFDMYESYVPNGEGKDSKIKIEGLNKVSLKNISEDDLEEILDSLNTSSDDIEKWKKQWNKEEREIRELEVELELEDILSGLKGLEEFLNISYTSAEEFIDETMVVKNLFLEIFARYQGLLSEKKIAKSLIDLNDKVSEEISRVSDKIDSNIVTVIENYNEQIKGLNNELERLNNKNTEFAKIMEKLDNIYSEIRERGLSLEEIKENEKKINEAYECLKKSKARYDGTMKNEEEASKICEKFFNLLSDNKKRFVTGAFNEITIIGNESAEDIFLQFARSLYEEKLIEYNEEFDDMESEEIMTYAAFREEKLNAEQRKLTDQAYKMFKENIEIRDEIFDELVEYINCFNIEGERLSNVSEAYSLLKKALKDIAKVNQKNKQLFDLREELTNKCLKIDTDEIRKEIEKTNENISDLVTKIEELNDKKINR